MSKYLYHITLLRNLESISERGLVTGRSQNWPGYSGHARGRVFLTEEAGINSWIYKVTYSAAMGTDYPVEEGFIPIVLRIPLKQIEESLHIDKLGSQDISSGASYYVEDNLSPEELEVYTPFRDWVPVDGVDFHEMLNYAMENAPRDVDDEEEYLLLDEYVFAPNPGSNRRRKEGFSMLPVGKIPKTKKSGRLIYQENVYRRRVTSSSSFKKPTKEMVEFFR